MNQPHLVVCGVDENFVEDFEEARNIGSVSVVSPVTKTAYRWTIMLVVESKTHIGWVTASMEPMYVSGRLRTCSSWDN